jgi:hypothetical protein
VCRDGWSGALCATAPQPASAPFLDTPAGKAAVAVPILTATALVALFAWRSARAAGGAAAGATFAAMGQPLTDEGAPLKGASRSFRGATPGLVTVDNPYQT